MKNDVASNVNDDVADNEEAGVVDVDANDGDDEQIEQIGSKFMFETTTFEDSRYCLHLPLSLLRHYIAMH